MPDGSFASASGPSGGGPGGGGQRSYASRGGPPSRPGGGPAPKTGAKEPIVLGKDGKRRKDRQDDNVLFGKNAADARRSARASRKVRERAAAVWEAKTAGGG